MESNIRDLLYSCQTGTFDPQFCELIGFRQLLLSLERYQGRLTLLKRLGMDEIDRLWEEYRRFLTLQRIICYDYAMRFRDQSVILNNMAVLADEIIEVSGMINQNFFFSSRGSALQIYSQSTKVRVVNDDGSFSFIHKGWISRQQWRKSILKMQLGVLSNIISQNAEIMTFLLYEQVNLGTFVDVKRSMRKSLHDINTRLSRRSNLHIEDWHRDFLGRIQNHSVRSTFGNMMSSILVITELLFEVMSTYQDYNIVRFMHECCCKQIRLLRYYYHQTENLNVFANSNIFRIPALANQLVKTQRLYSRPSNLPIKSMAQVFEEVTIVEIEWILEKVKSIFGVRLFLEMKLYIMQQRFGKRRTPLMFKEKIRKMLKKRGVKFIGCALIFQKWNVITSLKTAKSARKQELNDAIAAIDDTKGRWIFPDFLSKSDIRMPSLKFNWSNDKRAGLAQMTI